MRELQKWAGSPLQSALLTLLFLVVVASAEGEVPNSGSPKTQHSHPTKQVGRQNDSLSSKPAPDLILRAEGQRKAGALSHFVEGMVFEENGEMDRALDVYRKVLNVVQGQSHFAARVAGLLIETEH